MADNDRDGHDALGPGATGAWSQEELEHARIPPLDPEQATREDDDPEALRAGTAEANVREDGEPLSEEAAHEAPAGNRHSIEPGNEGYRRGEEELDRGTV